LTVEWRSAVGNASLRLMSVYAAPHSEVRPLQPASFSGALTTALRSWRPDVALGDFNARHIAWDPFVTGAGSYSAQRGAHLLHDARALGLDVCAPAVQRQMAESGAALIAPLTACIVPSWRALCGGARPGTISSEKPPLHVKGVVASLDIARCLRLPQPDAMRWVADSEVYRIIDEQLRDSTARVREHRTATCLRSPQSRNSRGLPVAHCNIYDRTHGRARRSAAPTHHRRAAHQRHP
jgi:hypothetical protein